MNIILKIARAELRNLFYSPVAWFLGIIFMVQCAYFYTESIYGFTKIQEYLMELPNFKLLDSNLTPEIFAGVFQSVMQNLSLFIPLLTMGILSREVSSGSIKLLYSSPIKTRHIVLGKFLSLMIFSLLLSTILGIFMITACFNIKSIDYGLLLSASLGFYLLVCAYAAIGFFMSSLTTYQIVSAIGTFTILFVLGRIGTLWQQIDFVRDLTYFLSMGGRTSNMLKGLITTKDVFYFLIVSVMFLGFTLIKLKAGRESKSKILTASKYLGVLGIALLLGYVTSRPKIIGYWDTTATKSNTLHPKLQKILKDLGDEPLEVTLYTNLLGDNAGYGMPENRNNYLAEMWEPYVRFKPDIQFKYEYYYDLAPNSDYFKSFPKKSKNELATDFAVAGDYNLSKFQTPEEMRSKVDLSSEDFRLVMQLKRNGKTSFLRTFLPPQIWPDETNVAASLLHLKAEKVPTILFLTDNLERDISVIGERGYYASTIMKKHARSLVNIGFYVDTISLDSRDIPYDSLNIAALVLADPKTSLSVLKQQKINDYLQSGGNMFILGEPGKEDILNPILQPLGVELVKGNLVQVTKHHPPNRIVSNLASAGYNLSEGLWGFSDENKRNDNDTVYSMTTESVVPIKYIRDNTFFAKSPLSITPLGATWLKKGILVIDSVPPIITSSKGDFKLESFVTAVGLTRQKNNKEQRIAVIGDADQFSNKGLFYNMDFKNAIFSWFAYNDYPVYTPRPDAKDRLMLIGSDTASRLKTLYVWALPTLLALLGAIILIRRKRK